MKKSKPIDITSNPDPILRFLEQQQDENRILRESLKDQLVKVETGLSDQIRATSEGFSQLAVSMAEFAGAQTRAEERQVEANKRSDALERYMKQEHDDMKADMRDIRHEHSSQIEMLKNNQTELRIATEGFRKSTEMFSKIGFAIFVAILATSVAQLAIAYNNTIKNTHQLESKGKDK